MVDDELSNLSHMQSLLKLNYFQGYNFLFFVACRAPSAAEKTGPIINQCARGVSGAEHTANTASILRETNLHPLLDLRAKQDPQRLAHALLEARIMLVQTIHTRKRTSAPIQYRPPLVTHLPSMPIAYGLPPNAGASAGRASFPSPLT